MLSPEEIAEQQELLEAYRRTLAVYLRQQAEIGRAYSPPGLVAGIRDTREHIRQIKETLRVAGVAVNEGLSDLPTATLPVLSIEPDSVSLHPIAPDSRQSTVPIWLLAGIVLLALLGLGGYWWYSTQRIGGVGQAETPQQERPAAEEAPAAAEQPTAAVPPDDDLASIESQLAKANIALSETQVEAVRGFISDPGTPYKVLAEHVIQVVGDRRFRQTIYLDEIDVRYTEVVGQDHYADYDPEQLKAGMLRAWNEHYPDQRFDSYDEIVEPQT